MRLRLRLTLVLLAVNVVVLGTLAWWTATDTSLRALREESRNRLFVEQVGTRLSERFESGETNGLRDILAWDGWTAFEDVVLVDDRILEVAGELVPVGAFLSPLGSRRRPPDFPLAEVTRATARATRTLEPVLAADGVALPLILHEKFSSRPREIWGGVWVRSADRPTVMAVSTLVVLAAIAATLLSAGLVYVFLGRTVLRPVERLASAAERFGAGRRSEQLPPPGHAEEIDRLVDSFREMRERISNFQAELEEEVARATVAAGEAERRAARQERLAAIGTLAAGLAHEINSPLAGALHGLETLRKEAASERAQRHGALTEEALQRIRDLVQKLLRLSPARVESGRCRVAGVFDDAAAFLAGRLRAIDWSVDVEPPDLQVEAAAGDLFPVVLNLMQNACDALGDGSGAGGGHLWLRARADGDRAVLEVEDDGPGVPDELLPRLFEPFVTTKEVGQGTGLGLALAHATVGQLGGRIEARNRSGGGFLVRIELPRAGEPT